MKIVIEGIFLKQMQNIGKTIEDEEKYCSHKNFKTSIKSCINTEKGAQSNPI